MLFQSALSKQHVRSSPLLRLVIVFAALGSFVLAPLARPQAIAPINPRSFHKSLDLQAKANTPASIRSLLVEIHSRTLSGPVPQSVLDRMARAQAGFMNRTQAPVTEADVANAVNVMGKALDPVTFTGTNALQVRLLRISMLPSLPTLMAGGSPRPRDQIVAYDLSPAGAIYLGLLLIHQKLANPAWFGDPDVQNKQWVSAARSSAAAHGPRAYLREEPPEQTNFRMMFQKGLASEGSSTTKAYHQFLDALGIGK